MQTVFDHLSEMQLAVMLVHKVPEDQQKNIEAESILLHVVKTIGELELIDHQSRLCLIDALLCLSTVHMHRSLDLHHVGTSQAPRPHSIIALLHTENYALQALNEIHKLEREDLNVVSLLVSVLDNLQAVKGVRGRYQEAADIAQYQLCLSFKHPRYGKEELEEMGIFEKLNEYMQRPGKEQIAIEDLKDTVCKL